jgi:hypothetical protein
MAKNTLGRQTSLPDLQQDRARCGFPEHIFFIFGRGYFLMKKPLCGIASGYSCSDFAIAPEGMSIRKISYSGFPYSFGK